MTIEDMTIKEKLAIKVLYLANFSIEEIAEFLKLDLANVRKLVAIFKK